MNLVMKFYEEKDNKILEVEVCENGGLIFSVNDASYEYPEAFDLDEAEADKFFEYIKELEKIRNS